MGALAGDVDYQHRLRADFRRRRVHPTIETLVWSHVIGKPTERIQLSADVTMNQKLDQERELFARLSVEEMEEIAAESQALVDKLMAKANARTPDDVALRRTSVEDGESSDAPSPTCTGNDVDSSGEGHGPLNRDRGKARRTAMLVAVSPSPAAGVDDVTGELSEPSTAPTNNDQRHAAGAETAPRDLP